MVYGWLAWRSVYSVPINASLDDLSFNSSLRDIYNLVLLVVQYFRTWMHHNIIQCPLFLNLHLEVQEALPLHSMYDWSHSYILCTLLPSKLVPLLGSTIHNLQEA